MVNRSKSTVISMMEEKQFGIAGQEIVVEKFLSGYELSFIGMVDGEHIYPFLVCKIINGS
nr:hypothetical protein [Coxiella-like endosymbiont of Rhipicephalus sanguineus]